MSTIREVAKHAGVSVGTVSKVLNGSDHCVDPASKERILASIRLLRYKPPPFEKNQKTAISHNIALIVPDLTERPLSRNGYVHLLLDSILERAALRGWSVTIFAMRMWDDVGNAVRRKYDGRCDGVIVVAPQPEHDIIPSLHSRGEPILQIGTTAWLEDVSSIDIDNIAIGKAAAQHLLDLGHKRIGFVTGRREQISSKERAEGFLSVAGAQGQKFFLLREEERISFAQSILDMGEERPTALMGWHDDLVFLLMDAFHQLGVQIPSEMSFVGVDDSTEAMDRLVPLTTFNNPLYEIGKAAADLVIDRVMDPNLPREIIKLPSRIIHRASTCPPGG